MQFSFRNLSLLALFAATASASSQFARTCENIETFGSMLRADCREYENGPLVPSMIDMNRCIKNHRGSLHCGRGTGDFEASCINCNMRGNTELECECRDVNYGHPYRPTHIDIDGCIGNYHGELHC